MDDRIIDINNISFSYGTQNILKNVALSVGKGEVVCLIGPNGAGKSTLIHIAMGLLFPRHGEIRINAQPLSSWSARALARFCAFVPQHPFMPSSFTVMESVLLGRTPYLNFLGLAGKKDREVADDAIRMVEIRHLVDRRISDISGGEQQRVILARAITQEPQCLFLDEPTNSLDIHHQVMILSFIRKMAKEKGAAVFMVLHDLNLASFFSDRLILLDEGEIIADGTPFDVLRHPRLLSVYKQSITIFPRPDDNLRPAVLPVAGNR